METYTILREIADSWMLLAMTLFFLAVIAFAYRPGSRKVHDAAASIPFRDDVRAGCSNNCPDCTCAPLTFPEPAE